MSREDERRFSTADLARSAGDEHAQDMGADMAARMHDSRQIVEDEHVTRADSAMDAPLRDSRRSMEADSMSRTGGDVASAEPLAALFHGPMADEFRQRWDAIQIGFVDDPRAAVRNADELVAHVLRSLAGSFADQRSQIEAGLGEGEHANTENMRIALQRYRSFFQRLLSL
jgi:hypothetical protein